MTKTHDAASQAEITPDRALELLLEGNRRYVENNRETRDFAEQRQATRGGQWPFAAVLSCIDSRAPAELVFDAGIGDIFSVRIAGNCVDEDVLGSIEYACKVAGSKLALVLGHSGCGAVKGACDGVELGHITALLEKIKPAVKSVADESDDGPRTSQDAPFVQAVVTRNVELAVAGLRERSAILRELEEAGEIRIAGAVYDIESGEVTLVG